MRIKLMEERILKSHKISIFNRSSGIISGVKEVISFDPNEIILDTEQGMLMIQGEELHVTKETIHIPASKAPKFKAMKSLKEKVNN